MYFSGQGKLFIASRDGSGNPGAFRFVGNVPQLNFQLNTEVSEHKEATSGQRLTDLRLLKSKSASINMTLEEFEKDNLAMALYGNQSVVSSGSVVDEVLPSSLMDGDYVRLNYPKVSSVVITDSAATPATLVEGTDYEVSSADHGTIKLLNVSAYTQPLKASYSYAQSTNVNMFTAGLNERFMRFEGLNTAANNAPVLVEFYRFVVDPLSQFNLITDEITSFELSGSVLYDSTKVNDALLGQFGRVVLL